MATTDRLLLLEDGPWSQMMDTENPSARVDGAYMLGQNVYPQDPTIGEELVGRPGTRPLGSVFVGDVAVNAVGQFKTASAEYTVAVVAGELYTIDWVTELWTKVITAADLTTAGIALTPTTGTRIALLNAFDQLLVSDATNPPFLWDGTTNGGLTALTNCPLLYGMPTIHQARLFGIKAIDRRTMVWSEADDPTTGYEAGGFNNAWTLRQTDPYPLTRVVGTNQGLVIFRARSTTMAVGDVGTLEFQSSDTQEAIDATVGTSNPFAVVEVGRNLVFLDADLRPQLIRPGATGVVSLWHNFRSTITHGPERASTEWCIGVHYVPADLILFAVPTVGFQMDMMLVLSAASETPVPVGVWSGWHEQTGAELITMAMVRRPTLDGLVIPVPTLLQGTWNGASGASVFLHGNPGDETFLTDDLTPLGTQAIYHLVHLQPLGYSTKREKIFDRVDASFRAGTVQTVSLWVRTPRGDSDPFTLDVEPAETALETKVTLGIDEVGRWIAPRIAHQSVGEAFGLTSVTVSAYTSDDDPEVP